MIFDGNFLELVPLIEFMGDIFGKHIEFVLHDFSKEPNTIVAIKNGEVTGRKVGDSISELTLKIINEVGQSDDMFNSYKLTTFPLKDHLVSHDLIIRDSLGKPRGLLCVNVSRKSYEGVLDVLDSLLNTNVREDSKEKNENFVEQSDFSFMELAISIVDNILSTVNVPLERITFEERLDIVRKIHDKGVFQLKSVHLITAKKLGISEATLYRYIGSLSEES